MKTRTMIGLGFSMLFTSSVAGAQEADSASHEYRGSAPAGALEITTGGGLGYAFGDISEGKSMSDVAGTGNVIQLGLGYRLDPKLMIGAYGEGGMYQPAEGSFGDRRNFSVAAGAQAQYHVLPFSRWDPWVGVGTGWRGYWMVDDEAGTSVLQGVDIVRAQVGVDYHFSPSFVITPTIGATVTQFIGESGPDDGGYHRLADARPVSFFSIGLGGRFDIGGSRIGQNKQLAKAEPGAR